MSGLKLLVFLFVALLVQKAECETIHMIPHGGSCQGVPTGPDLRCLTLQQYLSNPSLSSDIRIELQPGNHTLNGSESLVVRDVTNFTIVSNGGILDCSENIGHHIIQFINIRNVHIGSTTVTDCQCNVTRVNELVVEGGSFRGITTTRPAFTLEDVTSAVFSEWSCSDYNNRCFGLTRSTLHVSDSTFNNNGDGTGVGVMSVGDSTVSVERCSFRNNRGNNGGVFYTSGGAGRRLTITNSSFSDNTATTNSGGVLHHDSGNTVFTISGSIFTNNRAEHSRNGGAFYLRNGANLMLTNSSFTSNVASLGGGAIYMETCAARIANTVFADNVASNGRGGAVDSRCRALSITNTHFHNNSATVNTDASGGALFSQGATELIMSTFTNNVATVDGGGVSVRGDRSSLLVNQTTFFNNTAAGGGGGAIHYTGQYESVSIVESDFSHNTALYCAIMDVDGYYHESINLTSSSFTYNRATGETPGRDSTCIRNATVFIVNSTLSHNSAAHHAGVFSIDGGIVTIIESSFVNNSAAGDGGVLYTYFYPTIYDIYGSTFSQNTAGDDGGVIFVGRADSEVRVQDSIFMENDAADRGGIASIVTSTLTMSTTNLMGNTATFGGIISACNSQVSVEDVIDLRVQSGPDCTHYSGDTNRHDLSIPRNYDEILNQPITPPISWQCDSFRIMPAPNNMHSCLVELTGIPCITLVDYINNPSIASNIYIELEAGIHRILSEFQLRIFNTANFTMVSNGATLDCSQSNGDHHITITDTSYVYLGDITIIDCQGYVARVDEFVVEGGSSRGVSTSRPALAMEVISDAVFRNWSCSDYRSVSHGRCIQASHSAVLVTDSTFNNNRAGSGGVIYVGDNSFFTIERCSFTNNRGENGGVFYNIAPATITVRCSTFSGNTADQQGGVFYSESSTVNIEGCSFQNNTAGRDGGVVYSMYSASTFNITRSSFRDNSATINGGALYLNRGWATMHNSIFTNNNATNTGGVSYTFGATLIISEANFLNNNAVNGGGVVRACKGSQITVDSDLQTETATGCTLYSGNIDRYSITSDYCSDPSDVLASTVGPQVLAICILPTYVPSTTSIPAEPLTTASPTMEFLTTTSPTTEPLTTTGPTTEPLTTAGPTTEPLTTAGPMTEPLTTAGPTTEPLSTAGPTTEGLTTEILTTTEPTKPADSTTDSLIDATSSSMVDKPTDAPLTTDSPSTAASTEPNITTDIPTTTVSSTESQDESTTTTTDVDQDVTVGNEEDRFPTTYIIVACFSVLCVVCIIGVVGIFVVIRRRKNKKPVSQPREPIPDEPEHSFTENKNAAYLY